MSERQDTDVSGFHWRRVAQAAGKNLHPAAIWAALLDPQSKAAGLSLLIHAAVLASMAAFTFEVLAESEDAATAFEEADEIFDGDIDTSLPDFDAGATSLDTSTPTVEFDPVPDLTAALLPTADVLSLPSLGQGAGSGAAFGDGPGDGGNLSSLPFGRPKEGQAVTKGSFTAWTVPEDPAPQQNYVIVIEIKVPRQIRRYPRADISGVVIGTDDYRQPLPGRGPSHIPRRGAIAQLAIPVPGAQRTVEDTIVIRSRILKEEQTLKLTF